MKKIIVFMLSAVMCLSMAGCGGGADVSETTQQLAADAVKELIATEAYTQAVQQYEDRHDEKVTAKIVHCAEYALEDHFGYKLDYILVKLQTKVIVDNGIHENVQLVIEPATGTVINSLENDVYLWLDSKGENLVESETDAMMYTLWAYDGYINHGNKTVNYEKETMVKASKDALANIGTLAGLA